MVASAREIEPWVRETLARMDASLDARRYGKVAALVMVAGIAAVAGVLLWRKMPRAAAE